MRIYRNTMITRDEQALIYEWVQTAIDFNPDKGVITAVREGAEAHGITMNDQEIEALAFDIIQFLNER